MSTVPGVVGMDNCQSYSVSIYPDSFPGLKEDASTWDQGFTHQFDYQTPTGDGPNVLDTSQLMLVKTGDDGESVGSTTITLDLKKVSEYLACTPVHITLQTRQSINQTSISNEITIDQGDHDPTG